MKKPCSAFLPGLALFVLVLSGCAGLRIPAPDEPVITVADPLLEPSTIAIPVTLSLDGILADLGFEGSRERISGRIRRFLKRQALKNETRLVHNRFVRRQLDQVWTAVQRPIPLRNGLSLILNPQTLSVSTLPDREDTITLILGVTARPKVTGGLAGFVPQPLPEISISAAPPLTGFHIALEMELPYEQLGSELTARLKGTTYSGKNGSITVGKVRVYGSGESLVAAVTVDGTVNGTVYLYGVPAYDREARTLMLREPDYTLETMQVLSRSADWLLHGGLREKLTQRAVWYVGDRIDAARAGLSDQLSRHGDGRVRVHGSITRMRPLSLGLTRRGLKAVLEADGVVDVQVLN